MSELGNDKDLKIKSDLESVGKARGENAKLTPQNILGDLTKRLTSFFKKKEKDTP